MMKQIAAKVPFRRCDNRSDKGLSSPLLTVAAAAGGLIAAAPTTPTARTDKPGHVHNS